MTNKKNTWENILNDDELINDYEFNDKFYCDSFDMDLESLNETGFRLS